MKIWKSPSATFASCLVAASMNLGCAPAEPTPDFQLPDVSQLEPPPQAELPTDLTPDAIRFASAFERFCSRLADDCKASLADCTRCKQEMTGKGRILCLQPCERAVASCEAAITCNNLLLGFNAPHEGD